MRAIAVAGALTVLALGLAGGARAERSESGTRAFQQGLLTAGGFHSCAVLTSARVRCWGDGSDGQLGSNDTAVVGDGPGEMQAAADVPLPADALAVAAGASHTCAVLVAGRLRCWGDGYWGQLGNDATTDIGSSPGSMQAAGDVPLPAAATAISAGETHTCALLVTGKVRCWGDGSDGQLGTNDTANVGDDPGEIQAAGDVPLPADAVAISAGAIHTCALLATGKVRCWGYGGDGRLGSDATASIGDQPGEMQALGDVALPADATAISAGTFHTCALLVTGKVRCWGDGNDGRLGSNGTADLGDQPGEMQALGDVPLPADAVGVTAGGNHTCALLATGRLRCFGYGNYGQLGSNATADIGDSPGSMQAASDVPLPGDLFGRVADLSLGAAAAPASAPAGGQATITLTLANAGPDAGEATVAAPVPAGLTAVTSAASRGTYTAATGTWSPGALATGEAATLTLTVGTPAAGVFAGAFEVVAAPVKDLDSTPGNGRAEEDDYAGISVAVTAPPATPSPTPAPAAKRCKVPKLKGLTLKRAKRRLRRARCAVGKVRKPKRKGKLVVRSSAPRRGADRPAGTKVKLVLGRRHR